MRMISYMSPGFPEALFEAVGAAVGATVDVDSRTSGPAPGDDPFRDGTYDLGWVCSTSFVDLSLRSETPSVQLAGVGWVPTDPDAGGRPVYFGDLVVRPDHPAVSLADLRGCRIGCNDVVSLSGYYALRHAITEGGDDPATFAELVFTGGHHASLDALVQGELDAAVVDSVVRTGRARHDAGVDALRVVDRLGPWPVQPLVARAGLDPSTVAEVQAAVLALNDDPVVRAILADAALDRFVATTPDHYAPVHAAFAPVG